MWDMVDGKKMYLLGMAMVGYAVYMYVGGDMSLKELVDYVFGGGLVVAVKSALVKVGM